MTDKTLSLHQVRTHIRQALKKQISFDASCITTVDPSTLLSTGSLTDTVIETIHDALLKNEYLTNDLNSHQQLAESTRSKAVSLQHSQKPNASIRLHTILIPAGFGDELRVALISKSTCWGFISLFRKLSSPYFTKEELKLLSRLASFFAEDLQSKQAQLVKTKDNDFTPGLLILNKDLQLIYSTGEGEKWLALMREWEGLSESQLPRSFQTLSIQLQKENTDHATLITSNLFGGIMQVRAEQLHHLKQDNTIAFHIEKASIENNQFYIQSHYQLSNRELDVILCIKKGLSTKLIADNLFISTYTVQDHLKSIFHKVDVHSRNELLSKIDQLL
ncbi:helix-turn-helix transcriptional regulator [Alkalicoccobacillus plakortidis]|uniref:LuxR C-terminal-related transcriptional regulator n=1 Tax=Alkalicoccobacillus plakortidis TaxID=444060 RepID=A0ABT0XEZ9_9BACI|nr:LuxR C-terminal-related transcriptional regulator [Alkalicoccobacillus plakortidis]MCM2674478.1 LuxR C-terminal-related transcriptional regulator [Alkalicoccobacillus plakortidis]